MPSRSQKLIAFALLITIPTTHAHGGFEISCGAFVLSVKEVTKKISKIATYPGEKLGNLYSRLRLWGKLDELDFELFDEATLRFQTNADALPKEGVIEEEIAYWEARLQDLPEHKKQITLKRTLKSGSWTDRYLLYRSIRGEAYDPIAYFRSLGALRANVRGRLDPLAIRSEQITRFLDDIYLLNHFDIQPDYRDLLSAKRELLLDQKLKNAAQRQIDRVGLEKFFKSRGALDDPHIADRVREFTSTNIWAGTVFALTNLGIGNGIMGVAFRLDFTAAMQKWGPKLYRDGIEAHWDDFVKEFRNKQKMEAASDAFRAAWMIAGTVMLGVLVYNEISDAQDTMENMTKSMQDVVNEQKEELEKIKAMTPEEFAFERWKNRYKTKHGGADPDPNSAEYRDAQDLYLGAKK